MQRTCDHHDLRPADDPELVECARCGRLLHPMFAHLPERLFPGRHRTPRNTTTTAKEAP